jgi:hypothetical protein
MGKNAPETSGEEVDRRQVLRVLQRYSVNCLLWLIADQARQSVPAGPPSAQKSSYTN